MPSKKDEEIIKKAGRSGEENSAPVEMMCRLKDSINKLNKTTARYSKVLVWLTILLFVVAFFQTIVLLKTVSSSDWEWVGLIALFITLIYFVVRQFEKGISP